MSAAIDARELPDELREKLRQELGLTSPRERRSLSLDHVRGHAIRVLAVVAQLSQRDRARVLKHAAKLNAV